MQISRKQWQVPPPLMDLLAEEVHIWCVNLDASGPSPSPVDFPLSEDEITRANRFHFKHDRERFVRTRAALRRILARYLLFSAFEIVFFYEPNGKPHLATTQNEIGLNFNVSHSGKFALVGVSRGRRIGIDVEHYRTLEFLEIARRYFSQSEYLQLTALPLTELQKNFFACWTRKEAFLKALGEGIGQLLSQVSVTVAHLERPKLIEFENDAHAALRWSFMDICLHEDYAAALVFERGPIQVRHWRFTE